MLSRSIVWAGLAGFAGGAVGSRVIPLQTAYAQTPTPDLVQAKSFVLLDSDNRKRGEWRIDTGGEPVLELYDKQGKLIWDSSDRPKIKMLSGH
jgi:hypothetical protein